MIQLHSNIELKVKPIWTSFKSPWVKVTQLEEREMGGRKSREEKGLPTWEATLKISNLSSRLSFSWWIERLEFEAGPSQGPLPGSNPQSYIIHCHVVTVNKIIEICTAIQGWGWKALKEQFHPLNYPAPYEICKNK